MIYSTAIGWTRELDGDREHFLDTCFGHILEMSAELDIDIDSFTVCEMGREFVVVAT